MKTKKAVKALRKTNLKLANDLAFAVANTERANARANEWRRKYEELSLTPEIKADTEAAFNRGAMHMKQSMASWLISEISQYAPPAQTEDTDDDQC